MPDDLLRDLESFGLFFEDMAVCDLKIYVGTLGGDVLHYRDIPEVFKGFNYITIKLVCSDYRQNYEQMKNRGNGLIYFELLEKMSQKIDARKCLVNEFELDIAGKTVEQVFIEALEIIEHKAIKMEYDYVKPKKELFYSWVFSNGLR